MTKTFIYNKYLETMYTKEAFKKEYLDSSEWSTDMDEWFDDYCNKNEISFSTLIALNEEEKKELCEEFLDWFLDEYANGIDLLIFREVWYEE